MQLGGSISSDRNRYALPVEASIVSQGTMQCQFGEYRLKLARMAGLNLKMIACRADRGRAIDSPYSAQGKMLMRGYGHDCAVVTYPFARTFFRRPARFRTTNSGFSVNRIPSVSPSRQRKSALKRPTVFT